MAEKKQIKTKILVKYDSRRIINKIWVYSKTIPNSISDDNHHIWCLIRNNNQYILSYFISSTYYNNKNEIRVRNKYRIAEKEQPSLLLRMRRVLFRFGEYVENNLYIGEAALNSSNEYGDICR